ncbi:hypothetical protein [Methylobacterium tardum]|uniref:Uncharacterized protein n=1 Tax=Methylobacterium tardum TaxID=374432 RepID=A0AA37TI80_9HYPH|nr:hypothetical protein [Methylobacterium tardum]URD35202.1 hypothetical protein M6G65_22110 [Methylobacterium tardum]GLS70397.1 hypothetical protein GCM10007890_24100 [Methylobacterium tardum]
MSDNPETLYERAAIQHMMRRLDGFARGLGLDEAATRQVVESVVFDMPEQDAGERLVEARARMILATV